VISLKVKICAKRIVVVWLSWKNQILEMSMICRNVGKLTIMIFFTVFEFAFRPLLYRVVHLVWVDFSYTKKIDNKFKLKFKDCLKKFFLRLITHFPAHLIFKKLYTINFSISEILQKICQKSATLPLFFSVLVQIGRIG